MHTGEVIFLYGCYSNGDKRSINAPCTPIQPNKKKWHEIVANSFFWVNNVQGFTFLNAKCARLGTARLELQHHLTVHRGHHIRRVYKVVQCWHCCCHEFGMIVRHFAINQFYKKEISMLVHIAATCALHTPISTRFELRLLKVQFHWGRTVRLLVRVVQARKVRVTQSLRGGQTLGWIEC